jgi:hypothetical protein
MALIRKDGISVRIVDTKKAEQLLSYFIEVALHTNKAISELKEPSIRKLRRGMVSVESEPEGIEAFEKLHKFELDRLGYEIGAMRLMYKGLKHSEFRSGQKDLLKFIKLSIKDSRVHATSKLGQAEEAKFNADILADRMLNVMKGLKRDLLPDKTIKLDERMQIDSYMDISRSYEKSLIDSFTRYIEKLREANEVEYLKLRFKRG